MKKCGNTGDNKDSNEKYGYLQIIYDSSGDFDTDYSVDVKHEGTSKLLPTNVTSEKNKTEHGFSCRSQNWRQNLKDNARLESHHSTNEKYESLETSNAHGKDSLMVNKGSTIGQPRSSSWRENSGSGFSYINCFKSDEQDDTETEDEFDDDLNRHDTDFNSNNDHDKMSSIYSQPPSLQDWSNASETFSYRKFRKFDPVTINKEIYRLDVEKLGYVFVDDDDVPNVSEAILTSYQTPTKRRFCVIL